MNETSTNNASKDSFSVDERFNEEPFAVMVARLSIEVTLAVLGLLGNVLVFFAISQQKTFRSGIKLFIRNLALADIGILAISFPFAVVNEQMPRRWPFGKAICLYLYPLAEVFLAVSVWSVTAIALERFRNIVAAVRRSSHISTRPIKWGILTIWLVSFVFVSLPLFFTMAYMEDDAGGIVCVMDSSRVVHNTYIAFQTVFWYGLPLGIIIFTYVKISGQIHKSNKFHRTNLQRRSEHKKPSDLRTRISDEAKRMKQNSKAQKLLTPIVFVFAISMLPLNLSRVLLVIWDELIFSKYFLVMYNVCVLGVVINSASDPLIYSIVSKDFRSELMASFQNTIRLRNLLNLKKEDNRSRNTRQSL